MGEVEEWQPVQPPAFSDCLALFGTVRIKGPCQIALSKSRLVLRTRPHCWAAERRHSSDPLTHYATHCYGASILSQLCDCLDRYLLHRIMPWRSDLCAIAS